MIWFYYDVHILYNANNARESCKSERQDKERQCCKSESKPVKVNAKAVKVSAKAKSSKAKTPKAEGVVELVVLHVSIF